jgi:type III secretion protein C
MNTIKITAQLLMALCVVMIASLCLRADAATLRLSETPIPIKASDSYEIGDLLKDLLSRDGVVAVISDDVKGKFTQSGRFKPKDLFDRVMRQYSLLSYYDGSVVYIVNASEVKTQSFAVNPQLTGRIISTLSTMGILDSRNTVRTNNRDGVLFVTGAPQFIQDVAGIVNATKSQSFASPPVVRFFPLKFAWASDVTITFNNKDIVLPGVATTLRRLMNMGPTRNVAVFDAVELPTQNPNTEPKLRGQGMRSEGRPAAKPFDQSGAMSPDSVNSRPSAADITRTMGNTDSASVEADRRTNGILVRDSVERMQSYEELIKSLDVEPMQVEIQAMIIDIDNNKLDELGVGWSGKNSRVGLDPRTSGSFGLKPDTNATGGIQLNNRGISLGFPAGVGGIDISGILTRNGDFKARLTALAETGAARVVSRPQIVTLANVEAILEAKETSYVPVNGAYEVDLFRVSTGTSLKVVPHFIGDGDNRKVRLFITIEDGVLEPNSLVSGGTNAIPPTVKEARVSTQVILMEGESLLLGGLTREKTNRGVTKIPLLGDIPYLGSLFKYQSNSSERRERLFLISPRLVPANRVPVKDTAFIEKPAVQSLTPLQEEQIK